MADNYSYLENRFLWMSIAFILLLIASLITSLLSIEHHFVSLFIPLFLLCLFLLLLLLFYFQILLPYRRNKHIWRLFATGYTFSAIVDNQVPLNKEMLMVNETLKSLLNTDQLMNASKRQAQFLALQNQINPQS